MLKISHSTPFARPADTTAYAIGDLIANSATAGSVAPGSIAAHPTAGGVGRIKRVQLFKGGSVLTLASIRVHFFATAPVPTNGDNGALLTTRAGYLGAFDVVVNRAFVSGASGGAIGNGIPTIGTEIPFDLASTAKRLYFLLEALAAYVPESAETFQVTATIEYE